jgi:2-amino-4-hydroxy-6-hydroxymethyldihydropteridine diphosphokinase
MNSIYLSIGSNLGERFETIQSAITKIQERIGKVIAISNIYESEPLGFESNDKFLNVCIQITTYLSAENLLDEIHSIEFEAGRVRLINGIYCSRPLDIDIIFYNKLIIKTDRLNVPHPHYHKRLFVLMPMADLIPDFSDPINGQTIIDLIEKCPDNSKLSLYKRTLKI